MNRLIITRKLRQPIFIWHRNSAKLGELLWLIKGLDFTGMNDFNKLVLLFNLFLLKLAVSTNLILIKN